VEVVVVLVASRSIHHQLLPIMGKKEELEEQVVIGTATVQLIANPVVEYLERVCTINHY
jgi:hypothetical protein